MNTNEIINGQFLTYTQAAISALCIYLICIYVPFFLRKIFKMENASKSLSREFDIVMLWFSLIVFVLLVDGKYMVILPAMLTAGAWLAGIFIFFRLISKLIKEVRESGVNISGKFGDKEINISTNKKEKE